MSTEKIGAGILAISDDPDALEGLAGVFRNNLDLAIVLSQALTAVPDSDAIQEVLGSLRRLQPELVLIRLSSGRLKQAQKVVQPLLASGSPMELVALLEDPTSEATIDLLKLGVSDIIYPPFSPEKLRLRVQRVIDGGKADEPLFLNLRQKLGLRQLIGQNAVFLAEVNKIPLIARCDANVLISGETGTGKEIFARSIHYLSRRAAKPFVAVSCGALPAELFENELFGHERGAFTGALTAQAGLIREAEGGSLFLDDVDCIPPSAQMKMLRFLQEKEFKPLGSARAQPSDTRIIASANRDLAQAVAQDAFRRDLYFRLNVLPLNLPPLRERREDIERLAKNFMQKYSKEFDRPLEGFSRQALQKLEAYEWPGNVRELENVIERAVVFASRPIVDENAIDLPQPETPAPPADFKEAKSQAVSQFEKKYVKELLATHGGNIAQSARAARKNRRAFWELMRKHKIDPRDFRSSFS